jgi:hypothetical protein
MPRQWGLTWVECGRYRYRSARAAPSTWSGGAAANVKGFGVPNQAFANLFQFCPVTCRYGSLERLPARHKNYNLDSQSPWLVAPLHTINAAHSENAGPQAQRRGNDTVPYTGGRSLQQQRPLAISPLAPITATHRATQSLGCPQSGVR